MIAVGIGTMCFCHTYINIGMCIGLSIGLAIGSAAGNIGVGMCIGVSVGMCLGVCLDRIQKEKTEKAPENQEKEAE